MSRVKSLFKHLFVKSYNPLCAGKHSVVPLWIYYHLIDLRQNSHRQSKSSGTCQLWVVLCAFTPEVQRREKEEFMLARLNEKRQRSRSFCQMSIHVGARQCLSASLCEHIFSNYTRN